MPHLVDQDVDAYGCLWAPDDAFPISVADHDWHTPYPRIDAVIPFEWERGGAGVRPNVFWCEQINDWICDESSYEVLSAVAGADLWVIAHGVLDRQRLFVVQVVTVIADAVDPAASVIHEHGSDQEMGFPAFYADLGESLSRRLFRVPDMYLEQFAGDEVERAFTSAGLTGLHFVRADSSRRDT